MTRNLKHPTTRCPLARRLDQIPMSESERRSAIEYMRRGERVADFVIALTRVVPGLTARLHRGIAIVRYAARKWLRSRAANARRTRPRAGTRTT